MKHTDNTQHYGLYRESGWYARVQILEDHSDVDFERYTLEVVEGANDLPLLPLGTRFTFARRRGVIFAGMGQLLVDERSTEA
jgi:hypothetical protein